MKYTVTVAFEVPCEVTFEVIARSRARAEAKALELAYLHSSEAKLRWDTAESYRVIDIERSKDLMVGEKP